MTTFEDGPAQGQCLRLTRVPRYLRVTVQDGKWDALNQPEDTALPAETLYAYEMKGEPGWCHVHAAGGRGGFFGVAVYRLVSFQPPDEVLRNNEAWVRWCVAREKRSVK